MSKRSRSKLKGKLLVLASSIVTLNLLGVSYAQWDDSLTVDTYLSTGYIEPYFSGQEIKIVGNVKGEVYVNTETRKDKGNEDNKKDDEEKTAEITLIPKGNTLEVSGWCYPTFNENVFVEVVNNGTLPITYNGINEEDSDDIIKQIQYKEGETNGNKEQTDLRNQDVLEPKESDTIKVHIQADNEKKADIGDHTFSYELKFDQATGY